MAEAVDKYAEQVRQAKHRVIEELTIAGAVILAGIGLLFIPVVGEFAAAGATVTAATLVSVTGAIGIELSLVAADIVATVLVGAAFGAIEAMTIDVVVAQPIRMAFGDQAWGHWDGKEVLAWGEGGAIGGGIGGGLCGATRLAGTMSREMAENAPRLASALGRLPEGSRPRSGRHWPAAASMRRTRTP